ncbi:uncharacterized protein TNCT_472251 [Trichonephila clavata]|uniref:Gustatory receptor n=1 Tax=Trichonephila clavata TaxID=2740835 RepID=A0A8X6J322_TRICU|nr:uncharacterized protein TNCT_472251 [Trichonephila clavata]
MALIVGLPISVNYVSGRLIFKRSQKMWIIFINVIKVLAFLISMHSVSKIILSPLVQMALHACIFGGFAINMITVIKRKQINTSLHNVTKLSRIVNPNIPIGNTFIKWLLLMHYFALAIFVAFMTSFFFYQEWDNFRESEAFPFVTLHSNYDLCATVVFFSIIFSFCISSNICGTMLLVCDSTYITLSNIIKAYGKNLKTRFRSGDFDRKSLTAETEMLNIITEQVEMADSALNMCAIMLYGMFVCMFYITVSIGFSKEESFKTKMVIGYIAWNFILAISLFRRLTMSGSSVNTESEHLKDVSVECFRSIISSCADEPTLLAFSLLFGSIQDTNLVVTGGRIFVIERSLYLTVAGTMVTYGVIIFQTNE